MSNDLRYTRNGDGSGHTVWGGKGSNRLGRVMKQGPRWLAITTEGRILGTFDAMSRAGERLSREDAGAD